ncbi:MAG TPA: TCP-1/cpn60 chaperonin family protein, partial [Bacillota bacterium]|nr:TCP-1/cpn60 chaperonin family protein [Bacillota bacterium]
LNAGFNPLEKVEEVLARLEGEDSFALGVNCETGMIEDLTRSGIWDPYFVKYFAIKSAGEVSEAVLRINTIIKMKEAELSRTGVPG